MSEQKEDAVAEAARLLDGLYVCTRDESAWGYGTMSLDDFHPAWQDEDVVNDFATLTVQPAISAEQLNLAAGYLSTTIAQYQHVMNVRGALRRALAEAGLTVAGESGE